MTVDTGVVQLCFGWDCSKAGCTETAATRRLVKLLEDQVIIMLTRLPSFGCRCG